MNCMRYLSIVLCSTVALLALLLCGMPPGTALGQAKKPGPAPDQDKKPMPAEPPVAMLPVELHSLRLRYARANEIAKLLENIFADTRIDVVADVRTNSLLLRVSAARLAEIQDLIKKVDTPADDPMHKISVYSLRSIEPDEALEAGLRLLFKGTGNFAVDRTRKLVIVSANEATMDSFSSPWPSHLCTAR